MRISTFFASTFAAVFLSACGPQDRPVDFYTKAENATEFAKALEFCTKSGLSQKDKCATVWQAKMELDRAADEALVLKAVNDAKGGTTVVQQAPRRPAAAEGASPRRAANSETATAETANQPSRN